MGAYISNAEGVIELHRFDLARVQEQGDECRRLLESARKKFQSAIVADNKLRIAVSNLSVAIGRQMQMKKAELKEANVGQVAQLFADIKKLYDEGLGKLTTLLATSGSELTHHNRCVVHNNIATWHYEFGAVHIMRYEKEAAEQGQKWFQAVTKPQRDKIEELARVARQAIDDAIAGREVVSAVFSTQVEVIWLEVEIGRAWDHSWIKDKEEKNAKLARFFSSVRSAVAYGDRYLSRAKITKERLENGKTGDEFLDFTGFFELMPGDSLPVKRQRFVTRFGQALGEPHW